MLKDFSSEKISSCQMVINEVFSQQSEWECYMAWEVFLHVHHTLPNFGEHRNF